ncbi:hypothetical protein ACVBEH_04920 [Roseateles sp. GG27B]
MLINMLLIFFQAMKDSGWTWPRSKKFSPSQIKSRLRLERNAEVSWLAVNTGQNPLLFAGERLDFDLCFPAHAAI